MSKNLQPPVPLVTLVKTEPPTVIKNETPEEVLEEEISRDVKEGIDIVYHPLSEDLIKSETVLEDILQNKHLEPMQTQALVLKTENSQFIKRENITKRYKSEDVSDDNVSKGTGQGVVEVQASNEHSNALSSLETDERSILNFSKDLNSISIRSKKVKQSEKTKLGKCYKTDETISWDKDKERVKVNKAPVIPIGPHEYTSLAKDRYVCNHCQYAFNRLHNLKLHIKLMHREVTTMYQCPYCSYKSKWSIKNHIISKHKDTKDIQWFQCNLCEKKFKLKYDLTKHKKVHLKHKQIQDGLDLRRHHCNKCNYRTDKSADLKRHKLSHLKLEEIQHFYCYHCSYKAKLKGNLKEHIFRHHFKNIEQAKRHHCKKCDYKTYSSTDLKNHEIIHLKPEEIEYFYCYHCSYKFKLKSYLKNHIFRQHFKNVKQGKRIAKYSVTIKNMSMQLQSTSTLLSVSLEKIEPLRAIKNEPLELEIGIDDIPNSLDEEIIPDVKDIDIVSHELSEDLIKSETVSENMFENNHSGSVQTHVFVKTENIPLIKTENLTQNEYLYKTQNTTDGNVSRGTSQGVIEVQEKEGSNEYFNALQSDKQFLLNFFKDLSDVNRKAKSPIKTDFSECYKTVETTSCEKDKKKGEAKHASNKNKSTHEKNKKRYCCEKCMYTSERSSDVKRHQLTHKTKAKMDDRLLKYRCNKCKYKTYSYNCFKLHKLSHLKPEEIHYFYCYHCSYKSKHKVNLQTHIFRHFKNEDVPFHCYICDFTTLKRNLIIEHFKKHRKHHSKCDETDYKNHFETYTMRYHYCKKCYFKTYHYERLKLHELTHKTEAKMDDRHFKYRCDKCKYKTFRHQSFKRHKLIHLKPEEIHFFYCYHCFYKCKQKAYLQIHIFRHFEKGEVPLHCYICDFTTLKRNLITEHLKKHPKHHSKCDETDYKNQLETYSMRYCCEKCTYTSGKSSDFKLHQLTHKTKAEIDDRLLKYRCDKCKFKSYRCNSLKKHKLTHLKPEEIQYFYCYHCSYKSKRKGDLKTHIFRHFKNEDVPFHCYICDFVTLKRESFKKHLKHHNKCEERI